MLRCSPVTGVFRQQRRVLITLSRAFQTGRDCQAPQGKKASPWNRPFWSCRHTWRRAGINTLRCLVGCTVGDFSALWMLQTYAPDLGMGTIMAASNMFLVSICNLR
ncbi:hypothetical protein BJX68DRAFT_154775 [Aspergillus pseudodeflectus]|uniref:DUF4396 domain-containing protein n=1 Tax=Aspergillus pseudodeflectus TaxID=176178 RepID=A0ABR4JVD7_9EURO